MPYIGNQHNVGDHVNNFKVLDDISSYTATFDGSATSVVSTSAETIRIPEHRFIQGQRVTYNNGGGSNIGGLTSGTAYYVSFDSANTIKLATSLANANSNTVINLSSVGGGTSHTLNAAFDGINTKFKLTFGSGNSARLNNATQINVAINNVIQRPNLDANNFTDGFALADNHKIVFKTAPTSQDIFWGSIISNTIENFDLRDNEVDNFTGNGSATEFNLSTIPANNESVIVTIDGVLQHPSDKNTSRAYTLLSNIIQFTAAPALNAEIQVRHIGFAGASTNDVSGFYGRTGNVTLTANDHITTGDITARNFKATGISTFSGAVSTGAITATTGTFSGNVSIGGTLTYEDVTNVDSVGILTARSGIHVTGVGSSVGIGTNNPDRIFHISTASPIIKLTDTDNSLSAEINGSSGNIYFDTHNNNRDIIFRGSTNEVARITGDGKVGIGTQQPSHELDIESTSPVIEMKDNDAGDSRFQIAQSGAQTYLDMDVGNLGSSSLRFRFAGQEKVRIKSDGKVGIGTDQAVTNAKLDIWGDGSAYPTLRLGTELYGTEGEDIRFGRTDIGGVDIRYHSIRTYHHADNSSNYMLFQLHDGGSAPFQSQATVLTLRGDNKVGIGTTTPQERLHIHEGDIVIGQDSGNSTNNRNYIKFGRVSAPKAAIGFINTTGNGRGDILFMNSDVSNTSEFTNSDEVVRITRQGNVGIGTNNPLSPLSIFSDAADEELIHFDMGSPTQRRGWKFKQGNTDTATELVLQADVNGKAFQIKNSSDGEQFFVNTSDSGAFVRINPDLHISDTIQHIGDSNTKIRFPADDTFSVETAGSERLRITSTGSLLINHTTARYNDLLQIEGTGGESTIAVVRNSNNGSGAGFFMGKSRTNSVGGNTIVNSGDKLGVISFGGADGTDLESLAAQITGEVDGTPGSNDMPGRLVFKTTSDGNASSTERVRIDSGGRMGVGLEPNTSDVTTDVSPGLIQTDGNIDIRYGGTNNDPSGARYINFINTDTTLVAGQPMGGLHWIGNDASNPNTITAAILADCSGNSGSASHLLFKSGGSERLRITSSGDVSISSGGTVHGVSKLTILPADRTSAFSPNNGDTWHDVVLVQGGSATNNAVGIAFELKNDGAYHKNAGTGIAAVKNGTNSDYGSDLVFVTRPQSAASTEKMRISAEGYVTKPKNAMFKAMRTSNQPVTSNGWVTIQFNSDTATGCFDVGSNFDTSNHRFTAPVTGYYQFGLNQRVDGGNGDYFRVAFSVNDGGLGDGYPYGHAIYRDADGFSYYSFSITSLIYLTAGQYVKAEAYSSSDSAWTLQRESIFYGYLVG